MKAVDVVAIPSLWDENHPMIAVEALRARRPLIVSNLGGLPELVRHDIDGWVLGAGDAEAWGQQLALLAADPGRITAAQKQLPPPRGGRAMANDFVDLYESVFSPATGTRP
jgi:glycosyltransferase involved in cell wall biosynthesis